MKTSKLITLDVELLKSLDTLNASKLINGLLIDYFNTGGHLRKQELIDKIQVNEAKVSQLNEEIKQMAENLTYLEVEEQRAKEMFKGVPKEIIDDFRFYPKMTEEIFENRYNELYRGKYNISWKELKKVFIEVKNSKETNKS